MLDATEISAFLSSQGSAEKPALAVNTYTGSPRLHIGISAPVLRAYVKSYIAAHKAELTPDAALDLLDQLYAGETLESLVVAGMMLALLHNVRRTLPLDRFERWLDGMTGWVEVDATCQSSFAPDEIYARWDEWAAFLRALNRDPRIAKRRASLVLLVRVVRESDDPRGIDLALELIDPLKAERDKLITKAVSWVLREAAKRHGAVVGAYIDANADALQSTIVREVRVKLATGKKR